MSQKRTERLGYALIIVTAVLAGGALLAQGQIPQDAAYHRFVDARTIASIPNFWNVVTNVPFAVVGLMGLYRLRTPGRLGFLPETRTAHAWLFAGTFLVSIGSGWYHLAPDNQTLVWDRLPMTIAFMALLSIIVGEFISTRAGKALLLPLILAGILSVGYWHFGEIRGSGDLRLYALVQFYPVLAIPVILVCFRSRCTQAQGYWWLLLLYAVAKVFEFLDGEVYGMLGVISGHSLKHLTAALAVYVLLAHFRKRVCR